MKNMKRIFSLVLALVMMMALTVAAGAQTNVPDGSITVNKAVDGFTYNAYRLLDLQSFAGSEADDAHAYTLNDTWSGFFTTGAGKDYVTINNNSDPAFVTWTAGTDDTTVKAFATAALAYAVENNITADASSAADEGTVTLSSLPLGYYLVDAGVGSLLELTTTDKTATIEEKNTKPGIDKKVSVPAGATIGDTVNYTIEVPIVKGAANYVVSDTMGEGLTFVPDSLTATLVMNGQQGGKQPVGATNTFILTTEGIDETFKVTVDEKFLDAASKSVAEGATYTIVFEYSAVINEKALVKSEITDAEGNTWNQATLNYGNNKKVDTDKHGADVDLYKITVNKVDSKGNKLDGAEFKLYDQNGIEVQVKKITAVGGDYYRPIVTGETPDVIVAGNATIKGLSKDAIYWLEETKAPAGYNKLTERVSVATTKETDEETNETTTVSAPLAGDTSTDVINLSGTELPATGGIGTTIFTVTGGLLMIGAAILFLTKKRSEG